MKREIVLIVACGVVARVIVALLFDTASCLWLGDTGGYVLESELLRQGIIPATMRSLGYPIFLAATLPHGPLFVQLCQCFISLCTAVATWRLLGENRLSLLTALLFATLPFVVLWDFLILSEGLTLNLLWLAFLFLNRRHWIVAGVLLGMALVTRDTLLLLPVFLLPLVLKERRYALTAAVAMSIAVPPLALPHGQSRFGLNLWIGTWERNVNWYLPGLDKPEFPTYAFKLPGEEQAIRKAWLKDDAVPRYWAVQRLSRDTAGTIVSWIARYPRLWVGTRSDNVQFRVERFSGAWIVLKLTFLALNVVMLVLGFLGLARSRGLFAVPVVYIALIYIPFHNAETRYSLPALPFLLFFGAQSMLMLWFSRRADSPTGASS